MLDENVEAFMVHMIFLSFSKPMILIHPVRKAQIASLIIEKLKISAEYSDFSDVFSEKKAFVLPELTKFN